MHNRGNTAYPTSVGSGDTAGGIGIAAQHRDDFTQGKDEHTHKQHRCSCPEREEDNAGNEQQQTKDGLRNLGKLFQ